MDVLIKNIEIPKEGRLVLAICPDGAVYKYFGDQNKYGEYRIDSAQKYLAKSPAVELPPHGDLIERNELLKLDNITYVDTGYWSTDYEAVKVAVIKKAPTIVEASYGSDN